MTAIMAMAALVLDGANIYVSRRMMQNASDAGSRAATRALLLWANETQILNCARAYTIGGFECPLGQIVTGNGASSFEAYYVDLAGNSLGRLPMGSVPSNARAVRVFATREFTALFAGILGRSTFTTTAKSTNRLAAIASISQVRLRPLAVQRQDWKLDDVVTLRGSSPGSPGSWGWITFNNDGGTNSMVDAIKNGYYVDNVDNQRMYTCSVTNQADCSWSGSVTWPRFIPTSTGNVSNGLQEAASNVGKTWTIPIYDGTNGLTGNNLKYKIVGLAEFLVIEVVSSGSDKYITGKFVRQVVYGKPDLSTNDCLKGEGGGYGACGIAMTE